MTRLFALSLSLLGLTACFDFAGDRGHLGFSTDARVDSLVPWTPSLPLARGTQPGVAVGEHLADGQEPKEVKLRTSRALQLVDGRLHGERRGWVEADADGVVDQFHVTWRDADQITSGPVGAPNEDDVLGILADHPSAVAIGLVDRRGGPLGFVPDELEVESSALMEWKDDVLHVTTATSTSMTLYWRGLSHTVNLQIVDEDDLALSIERLELGGQCTLVAVADASGIPVLDPGEVVWSHSEATGPFAPCADHVEVHLAGR